VFVGQAKHEISRRWPIHAAAASVLTDRQDVALITTRIEDREATIMPARRSRIEGK
jgi:hypothetical protein